MNKTEYCVQVMHDGKPGFLDPLGRFVEEYPDAMRTDSIRLAKNAAKLHGGEVWADLGIDTQRIIR